MERVIHTSWIRSLLHVPKMRMNTFEFICAEPHIDFDNTLDDGLMIEQDAIVQKVLKISPDTINFIAIFGSRARGDDTRNSDLDIAISTSLADKSERFNLKLKIISEFEGPDQKIDVVIVEESNWSINYRIARDGVVIYQRDNDAWTNFVERVLIFYPDYRYFEEKILRETLESS